jgi:hypothetical protein
MYTDQVEDGLLLFGELTNNTGTTQELWLVSGLFYDAQGQLIADDDSVYDYWPIDVVPPDGRVPFVLEIDGISSAADFKLRVDADPGSETPRQDFEFLDLNQWTEDDSYCLAGRLRNPGGQLQDYLVIVATLYDGQGNVVNFYDDYGLDLEDLVGDQTQGFEICVDPPNQDTARYELRAWGQ